MPSVRGRERLITIAVFVVSVTASSALLGFVVGVALGWIPGPSTAAVVSVLLAALVADVIAQRTGHLAPIAVGKQVPREWGRIFSAPVVAVLYGARLGIAPLTILSTWSWWAVVVLGGVGGVAWSVPVGVAFGIVRSVTSVSASLIAERSSTRSAWFTRLQTGRSVGDRGLRVATIVGVAVLALAAAGCTGGGDVDEVTAPTSGPAGPTITQPTEEDAVTTTEPDEPTSSTTTASTITTTTAPTTTSVTTPATPAGGLESLVIDEVAGFARIDQPGADTALDLAAAAARQPDPSEERPLLETRGFQAGWTRAFRNDTQDVVIASVYEFESPTAADFYRQDGLITVGAYGGELFDVAGFPEAQGFRQEVPGDDGTLVTYGVTFTVGSRWYLVYILGDPATATSDVVVQAAIEQFAAAQG